MVDINVQKDKGLIFSIRQELNKQNYDTSDADFSIWEQVMNEVKTENDENIKNGKEKIYREGSDLKGDGHSNFVVDPGIVQFSQKLWNKICSFFKKSEGKEEVSAKTEVDSQGEVKDSENIQKQDEIQALSIEEIKAAGKENVYKNVNYASQYLVDNLGSLSDEELNTLGINREKLNRIINYLKDISYENNVSSDTMQATMKDGKPAIFVNLKLNDFEFLGKDENGNPCIADKNNFMNMITMLIHEANHCDESLNPDNIINTKQEEINCETLGIKTTMLFMQKQDKDFDKNYGRYNGHSFNDYITQPDLLEKDIKQWANKAYTNYPDDLNGNITIEHAYNQTMMDLYGNNKPNFNEKIKFQKGDKIKIGDDVFTIGVDSLMDSGDSMPIMQINKKYKSAGCGNIIFNDVIPSAAELAKAGQPDLLKLKKKPVILIRQGEVETKVIGYAYYK